MRKIILALAACFLTTFAYAEVYKWVDENGVVHYSDKKPQNAASEQMKVKSRLPSSQRKSVEEQRQELDDKQEVDRIRKQQEEEFQVADKAKKEECDKLKSNLNTLNNKARIRIEEDGEQRFLSPEEILEKRKETQKRVDERC